MPMEVFEPNDLAFSRHEPGQRPQQLWAGEAQKVTEPFAKADAAATFSKYEVVGIDANGKVIKLVKGSYALGFVAQPVGAGDSSVVVYTAGYPNHEALVWPSDMTTFEDRRSAFLGHGGIHIGKLNGNAPV